MVKEPEREQQAVTLPWQPELAVHVDVVDPHLRAQTVAQRRRPPQAVHVGRRGINHVDIPTPDRLEHERKITVRAPDVCHRLASRQLAEVAILPVEEAVEVRDVVEDAVQVPGDPLLRVSPRPIQTLFELSPSRDQLRDVHRCAI